MLQRAAVRFAKVAIDLTLVYSYHLVAQSRIKRSKCHALKTKRLEKKRL